MRQRTTWLLAVCLAAVGCAAERAATIEGRVLSVDTLSARAGVELYDPVAVMQGPNGDVYVLDRGNSELYRFRGTRVDTLASADRFIGNDSGPGHLAALLGVPTFTIFGPQLPQLFAPQHPHAAWIEGAACPYKPCFDACRFPRPHCIETLSLDAVWPRVQAWL